MSDINKKNQQIYNASWTMICGLNTLSLEENTFLLSLLDIIAKGKADAAFINCLKRWQTGNWSDDINDIIKASLLPLDLDDPAAVKETCMLISDLLNYKDDGENH